MRMYDDFSANVFEYEKSELVSWKNQQTYHISIKGYTIEVLQLSN